MSEIRPTETVQIADLKKHPRNYRKHPADQIAHLARSITEHGFYRNIVIAEDGTILAGHGVVQAAESKLGLTEVPVIRLPIGPDDPRALKVLAGDNELPLLAEIDDRELSQLLKDILDSDPLEGLLGTGYDKQMLANLLYVTRPASEIRDMAAAAAWVGLPEYERVDGDGLKLVVHFTSQEDRAAFVEKVGIEARDADKGTWSAWWPYKGKSDLSSLRFDEKAEAET